MATTYRLTTLKDIFDNVPRSRIEACLSEIAHGMLYIKDLADLAGDPLDWQEPCEWIDDGLTNQTITVTDSSTSETVLTVEIKQDA